MSSLFEIDFVQVGLVIAICAFLVVLLWFLWPRFSSHLRRGMARSMHPERQHYAQAPIVTAQGRARLRDQCFLYTHSLACVAQLAGAYERSEFALYASSVHQLFTSMSIKLMRIKFHVGVLFYLEPNVGP
jgi:hypothetical protein